MLMKLMLVFVGGGCGAVLRWLMWVMLNSSQRAESAAAGFPTATLLVNLLGCFAIGLLAGPLADTAREPMRLLLVVGILGGFTTFSAFGWETLELVQQRAWGVAILYCCLSVVGGTLLAAAGALVTSARVVTP
ncbi:MAG: fluoride efflux transporter CrcB [Phycisphaerales bacterium]